MARLIAHQLLAPAPWKNGGGSTTELAVFPAGAGFDDFDWRISLANLTRSGPFSLFPGVDRSLALVDGEGLSLTIAGRPDVHLGAGAPPLAFAGEVAVHASLSAPSVDFNVMTRRGRCRHQLRALAAPPSLSRRGDATLVFLAAGAALTLGRQFRLGRFDALLLDGADAATWAVEAAAPATVLVADIFFEPAA